MKKIFCFLILFISIEGYSQASFIPSGGIKIGASPRRVPILSYGLDSLVNSYFSMNTYLPHFTGGKNMYLGDSTFIDYANLLIGFNPNSIYGIPDTRNPISAHRDIDNNSFIEIENINYGVHGISGFLANSDIAGAEVGLLALSSTNSDINPAWAGYGGVFSVNSPLFLSSSSDLIFGPGVTEAMRINTLGNTSIVNTLELLGGVASLSNLGTGKLFYDNSLNHFEVSENGGAYAQLLTSSDVNLQEAYVGGQTIGENTGAIEITRGSGTDTEPLLVVSNNLSGSNQSAIYASSNQGANVVPLKTSIFDGTNNTNLTAFSLEHNFSSGAAGMGVNFISQMKSDGGNQRNFLKFSSLISDPTDAAEYGTFKIEQMQNGALTSIIESTGSGNTSFNTPNLSLTDVFTIRNPYNAGNISIFSLYTQSLSKVLAVNPNGAISAGVLNGYMDGNNNLGGQMVFVQQSTDATILSNRYADLTMGAASAGYMRLWDGFGSVPTRISAVASDDSYINNGGNFGVGTSSPDASAKVDITSVTSGFLPPRMTTTQRTSIPSPADGLIVYDLTLHLPFYWNGTIWVSM